MKSKNATLFVIDDDQAVRESLGSLAKANGYRFAGYATGQEFLEDYDKEALGCLLLDVRLQGADGLDVQKQLHDRVSLPVIVVSGYADTPTTVRAIKQGALDVLDKPLNNKALLERVDDAIKQHKKIRKWELERNEVAAREASLTPRETEVYSLMSEGKSNKIIAAELGISHKTLDIHRANVMRKMQAKTTGEIVRMSYLSKGAPSNGR